MWIGTRSIARVARITRIAAGFTVLTALPVAARAQKTFVGMTGAVFRYHGDTIWMSQDTTETRSIIHGDTVINRRSINDQLENETTAVVHGDSALIIAMTGRDGRPRPVPPARSTMPAMIATFAQKMLEMESRTANLGGGMAARFGPPTSPDSTLEYVLSPASRIMQHRDTVRIIKGCPSERTDTTTFLLFGTDSTRRLTAPQRTFGEPMAQTLIGEMRNARLQEMVAVMMPGAPADMPKTMNTCGHR